MLKVNSLHIGELKNKLEIDLLGVARIDETSTELIRNSAAALLPGAASVIVFGKEIYRELVALIAPSNEVGAAEPAALLKPHYNYLNGRLNRAIYFVSDMLRKEGFRTLPLPPVDCPTDQRTLVAVFSYKHAAVAAGLGTIGRNGLLVTREFGPRVRLACLLTDAPLEATPLPGENFCRDCKACIRACPAGSLSEPAGDEIYAMNKFSCRTYRQTGLTCSLCIKVCDRGQKTDEGR